MYPRNKILIIIGISLLLSGCGNNYAPHLETPSFTSLPTETYTPIKTFTPTKTSTYTVVPITYVTLGSPFSPDCGDGIPRIWVNDAFNAPGWHQVDEFHGHVDIFPPQRCDPRTYQGEVIAPNPGHIEMYGDGLGYFIILPKNVLIDGIDDAFSFIEVPFYPSKVTQIRIALGHVSLKDNIDISKGESIGDLVELPPEISHRFKIAELIMIVYDGQEYAFSPTLFTIDGSIWPCVPNSPYDCVAEPFDYIK